MNSTKNNDYIDLLDLAKRLWAYKAAIIIVAIIVALMSVIRVEFFVEEQYISRGMLYVTNQRTELEEYDNTKNVSQGDIDTAKSLNATYREVLKSRRFLKEVEATVSEKIGKKYTWNQIGSMISLSAVNDTELMRISVRSTSGEDSLVVAECVMELAPGTLDEIFGNGSVKVVDDAAYSGAVGKGTMGEAVKGGVLGAALVIATIVILGLFDTKVHKSEDVAKKYNISILGEIAQ